MHRLAGEAGAVACPTKPFGLADLVGAVKGALTAQGEAGEGGA